MKRLEKTVEVRGVGMSNLKAQQLKRDKNVAMYKRSDEKYECYEVFIIKVQRANTFPDGTSYPDREVYPNNEDFGENAWCFVNNKEKALVKYNELVSIQAVVPPKKPRSHLSRG